MIPIQRFMPEVVADLLRKTPLTPEKVAFAWRTAVGAAVDKVTSVELRDRVLHVQVKDAAWHREVERSAALIRARLDTVLGDGVVRYLDVTVERPTASLEGGPGNGRRNR